MALLGDVLPLTVQQQTEDCPNSVHEDVKDENEVEVNYDPDSSDEVDESALRAETMVGSIRRRGISILI